MHELLKGSQDGNATFSFCVRPNNDPDGEFFVVLKTRRGKLPRDDNLPSLFFPPHTQTPKNFMLTSATAEETAFLKYGEEEKDLMMTLYAQAEHNLDINLKKRIAPAIKVIISITLVISSPRPIRIFRKN